MCSQLCGIEKYSVIVGAILVVMQIEHMSDKLILIAIIILVGVPLQLNGCVPPFAAIQLAAMKQSEEYANQQFDIAESYRLESDFEKAYQHYRYAAFEGHQEAAMWLGKYYYNGIGTDKDYTKARRVFEMIVQRDEVDKEEESYLYLSEIDFYGKDRPSAIVQGYKWMLIGTRNSPVKRSKLKAELAPNMRAADIAKGTQFAKNWLQWRGRDTSGI